MRILVKAPAHLPSASLSLAGADVRFTGEPLLRSIEANAAGSVWQALTSEVEVDRHPWDVCHQFMGQGLGVAGGTPDFVEPDLPQQWVTGHSVATGLGVARTCDMVSAQDNRFPVEPDPLWFHDSAHAQFADALATLGPIDRASVARVAHFDTGYDATHSALPEFLNLSLQHNFVDSDRPADARDISSGLGANLGHGTGTIGVLAGKATAALPAIGAAPFVDVVPMRVANSVALFYNSAIATAFDWVHELCADSQTRIDVITMSMGGLASASWADAVNALYDMGVFIVTAAGNNISNLPTRNIVFPARFNRVVAACGVMANDVAYADLGVGLMAGNYGPDSKMRTAIAGFTPTIPGHASDVRIRSISTVQVPHALLRR